jgi:hypothetical protein
LVKIKFKKSGTNQAVGAVRETNVRLTAKTFFDLTR